MSIDGLEPPGCPLPGVCACPGGEAEMAKRLAATIRERDAAIAQRDRAVEVMRDMVDGCDECPVCDAYLADDEQHAKTCDLNAIIADTQFRAEAKLGTRLERLAAVLAPETGKEDKP